MRGTNDRLVDFDAGSSAIIKSYPQERKPFMELIKITI
jgi:hypothetical protein